MIFILMIWFILTRNTEMSFIMENIYPVKGTFPSNRMKSEDNSNEDNRYEMHLKKQRKVLISPFTPARNSSSRTNSFTGWNENLKMPFSKHDKLIKSRNPSTLAADSVAHKPKYLPLPPFLQPKKAKPFQDFSSFIKEMSLFTSKLPIEGRILSKYNQQVENSFLTLPNQSGLKAPVQQDFPQASSVRRVINEPKYLPLPPFLQPKEAKPFQDFSTSMTEMRRFAPKLPSESRILPEYEQPVKSVVISFLTPPKQHVLVPVQNIMSKQDVPRDLPQTSSVRQAINEPKYLTLPPFYKFTKSKPLEESSASLKTIFFTSKFPHGRTTLLEYIQPATNIFIPSSTPPSRFELTKPAQNYMSEQENVFEDKLRAAKSFPNILSERTTLLEYKQPATNIFIPTSTPSSHFELTRLAQNDVPEQENLPEDELKALKAYIDIPSNRTTLYEYKQTAANIFIPNPTSPNHSEFTVPVQNTVSKQENVFVDELKTEKPVLVGFTDVNEKIPSLFDAFRNSALPQQFETVQGQNRLTHISKTMPFNMSNAKKYSQNVKNIPLNVTNARMYSQYDKNFKTYNRTLSSPRSIGMNSTEMSSLQYLHHKLKQAKDIHDRLGSNTKILVWSIAAFLVIVILILILTSVYRHYKDKKKKKYPFQKKKFTLLRATKEQQKDILNRIGKIKYSKLTEEDFEE